MKPGSITPAPKSKKQRVLDMFNDRDWIQSPGGMTCKTFSYEDFRSNNLGATIEYQEKYNDVLYAARIMRDMGHGVGIGMAFHVFKDRLKNERNK